MDRIHDFNCENQTNFEFFANCTKLIIPGEVSIRDEHEPSLPTEVPIKSEPESEPPAPDEEKIRTSYGRSITSRRRCTKKLTSFKNTRTNTHTELSAASKKVNSTNDF
jgi:hypothetical protein